MIRVIIISALFSLIFPLGKIAMAYCPPFFLIGLRMMLCGTIFLGYWALIVRQKVPWSMNFAWKIFLLAFFNVFLTNSFEFWGLQYMSSAKTCFIYNLAPLFSALFAYLHLKEHMTLKKWGGIFISLLGFLPIIMSYAPDESTLLHIGFLSSAEISLLVATIGSVYGWIIMQHIMRKERWHVSLANGFSMLLGGLFSLMASYIQEQPWQPTPVVQWWPFLGYLFLIVIISNIIYAWYTQLLQRYTATFMAFSGLTGPVFAALYDWLMFGITVPLEFYIAIILVTLGLYIFYQEDLRQGYVLAK